MGGARNTAQASSGGWGVRQLQGTVTREEEAKGIIMYDFFNKLASRVNSGVKLKQ
jgi:hypothetical protein